MNYLVLAAALGLLVIWLIALFTGGVSAWFLWLVLVSAAVLLLSGAASMSRRRTSTPA